MNEEQEETKRSDQFNDDVNQMSLDICAKLFVMFQKNDKCVCYAAMAKSLILLGKTYKFPDEVQKEVLEGWLTTYSKLDLSKLDR